MNKITTFGQYLENLSGSIIKDLVETSCHLVRSENKEVILASLNLLKVLCSIFQSTTLAQYLENICDAIHSLHEKRASAANEAAVPPISKSHRIKLLVKLILKKLMKKFTYELILAKIFANESSPGSKMDTGESHKPALTAVVRHGLENLLVNLKKMIEKERLKKIEEQTESKKSNKTGAVDLVSVYTSATDKDNSKSVVLNE